MFMRLLDVRNLRIPAADCQTLDFVVHYETLQATSFVEFWSLIVALFVVLFRWWRKGQLLNRESLSKEFRCNCCPGDKLVDFPKLGICLPPPVLMRMRKITIWPHNAAAPLLFPHLHLLCCHLNFHSSKTFTEAEKWKLSAYSLSSFHSLYGF